MTDVEKLLRWFADTETRESLYWNFKADKLEFYILCNDMFWWGTADAEDVTAADVPELQRAYDDLDKFATDFTLYAPELWVARKRGMRPQTPWWDRERFPESVKQLFLDAGPPRDRKEEG